jgi:putative DNA primase/helicase
LLPDYELLKGLRWKLATLLVKAYSFLIIPLYPYNYQKDESKRGKVPWISWKNLESTSQQDLEEWQKRFNGDSNLGLCLGLKSGGLLGIDVDGEEGTALLEEMSAGDLPPTVTYSTPGGNNGGLRYLYRYPPEYQGKIFRKFSKAGKGDHSELAILAEGQQTVLPYSIHPNGKVYEFIKGRSFDDIEITVAPNWVMDALLKKEQTSSKSVISPGLPVKTEVNAGVEDLIAKSGCHRLQRLLEEQKSEESLPEQRWFEVISFLTAAGYPDAAREFSEFSHKHNKRSIERLEALAQEERRGTTRCLTFGCSEEDVKQCFKKLRHNDAGEITNSPAVKLKQKEKTSLAEKITTSDTGLLYDSEGRFIGVNFNAFLRYFINKHDLRILEGRRGEDSRYYLYKGEQYWHEISELRLRRLLRDSLNDCESDAWTPSIGKNCFDTLPLECREPVDLDNSSKYINVQNGLINLDTLTLEPHRKDVFSTTQLPLIYKENAECPRFIDFLKDIFFGEQDMILLTQEVFGYALSPSIDAHKFFCFIGDGANAKSVMAKVLSSLVGEKNISRISLRRFNERFGLASIVDKRLVIATENETKRGIDSEILKAITAGDPIHIERKFADVFDYTPALKMFFLMNRPPKFNDNSFALRRRLLIIPFEKCFVDDPTTKFEGKKDIHIVDSLLLELPEILAWSLQGWKRLRDNEFQFTMPKKVKEYLEEYLLEFNPFLDYVYQCIMPFPGGKISPKELFLSVTGFLVENGYKQDASDLSTRSTAREIESLLKSEHISFHRHKSNGIRYFKDISLNQDGAKYLRHGNGSDY